MKNILLIILILAGLTVAGQVTRVTFRASGLTCSMCSNAIYKKLKTLEFVDAIETDLSNYTFRLTFRKEMPVNFDRIRAKVEDAGFSVADFTADINLDDITVNNDNSISIGESRLIPTKPAEHQRNAMLTVRFLDKRFVLAKEFRNSLIINSQAAEQIYHVSVH